MADAHVNFAHSTVATAPSPAASGTSLVVASGEGALFPAVPFNATIWPVGVVPTAANGEIVRVTGRSTDTLTIVRAQESSSARTVVVGDQIAATITARTLTDVETSIATLALRPSGSTDHVAMQAAIDTLDAAGGGILQLYAGTYTVSAAITVPTRVYVIGQGLSTLVNANSGTVSTGVFKTESAGTSSQWSLQNMRIENTAGSPAGIGVDASDSSYVRLRNLRIIGWGTGLKLDDSTNTTFYCSFHELDIRDCTICVDIATSGTQPNDNNFYALRTRPVSGSSATRGIRIADARGIGFFGANVESGGTAASNGTGIELTASAREIVFYNSWVENHLVGVLITSGANRNSFFGGSITSNTTDITDNGTATTWLGINQTGTLRSRLPGGTVAPTLNANSTVISSVADPVADSDAANRQYTLDHGLVGIGRLTILSHSYASEYGGFAGQYWTGYGKAYARIQGKWSTLLARALGVADEQRFIETYVPPVAAASSTRTVLYILSDDAYIEAVSFTPAATITGANTNTRRCILEVGGLLGQGPVGYVQFNSGTDAKAYEERVLIDTAVAALAPRSVGFLSATATPTVGAVNLPGVNNWDISSLGSSPTQTITWHSQTVGTGIADPGGQVTIRLGARYRNISVAAMDLLNAGMYLGGWGAAFSTRPLHKAPGIPVVTNADAASSATSMTVINLTVGLTSADRIYFANGVVAVLSASPAYNATTISVNALSGAVPAGTQGFVTSASNATAGTTDSPIFDTLHPDGTYVIMHGTNHIAAGTQERPAYRSTLRAVAAYYSCPYFVSANSPFGVCQTAAGNGAGAAWTDNHVASAGLEPGQYHQSNEQGYVTGGRRFTGAVGGTKPTATISVGPAFPGGTLCVFLLARAGATKGAQGTITIDGGTPPQGTVTFDTSGLSTANGIATLGSVGTTNASPNLTGVFLDSHVGRLITGSNIPGDTYVKSVVEGASAIMSRNATSTTSITATFTADHPMVKRLTGLAVGSHTVLITVDTIDATDGSAALSIAGIGWESVPFVPVVICNVPYGPGHSTTLRTNADNLNTDYAAVIAGTAAAHGTGSQEPALNAGVLLADIKSVIPHTDESLWRNDGGHPSGRGHLKVAEYLHRLIRGSYTSEQLLSR